MNEDTDFIYDREAEPNMRAALTPSPVGELVERLEKVAGPVRMNNDSFSDLAAEAADRLTALEAENARLREALKDVRYNGLIYWEPNTHRGWVRKAEMIERIQALTAPQGGDHE